MKMEGEKKTCEIWEEGSVSLGEEDGERRAKRSAWILLFLLLFPELRGGIRIRLAVGLVSTVLVVVGVLHRGRCLGGAAL